LGPGKKVRKTKKVKIGDHVDIMFQGHDYPAVVSKINKITFVANFDDGSDAMPEIKD
jgi:bifunctional DNA-binding transcriptional regulator/antitoxin component of YhaV-PrlF toxin-antitoxin module